MTDQGGRRRRQTLKTAQCSLPAINRAHKSPHLVEENPGAPMKRYGSVYYGRCKKAHDKNTTTNRQTPRRQHPPSLKSAGLRNHWGSTALFNLRGAERQASPCGSWRVHRARLRSSTFRPDRRCEGAPQGFGHMKMPVCVRLSPRVSSHGDAHAHIKVRCQSLRRLP